MPVPERIRKFWKNITAICISLFMIFHSLPVARWQGEIAYINKASESSCYLPFYLGGAIPPDVFRDIWDTYLWFNVIIGVIMLFVALWWWNEA